MTESINKQLACSHRDFFSIFYKIYNEKIFNSTNERHQHVASRQLATQMYHHTYTATQQIAT